MKVLWRAADSSIVRGLKIQARGAQRYGWALAIALGVACGLAPAGRAGGPGARGRGSPMPDFVIASLDVPRWTSESEFRAEVGVRNQGGQAGDAGVLRLWIARRGDAVPEAIDRPVGVLKAGASATVVFEGLSAPAKPGLFKILAAADADHAADETSEGNNHRLAVCVRLPGGEPPPQGTVRYVAAGNADAMAPFTSWETAAATIQAAVDAADEGDTIQVGPGIYDAGETADPSGEMNRVAIGRSLRVVAVDGPEATTILGSGADGGPAIRCAYVSNAVLSGFTLTGGLAGSGGGVFCDRGAEIRDCTIAGNASDWGAGAAGAVGEATVDAGHGEHLEVAGTLAGCRLVGNRGIGACTLALVTNCLVAQGTDLGLYYVPCIQGSTIVSNQGGGASNPGFGLIETSTVGWNTSPFSGGGVSAFRTVRNCVVEGNIASTGAGIAGLGLSSVVGCTIRGNGALSFGGGLSDVAEARNCIVEGNTAYHGGGVFGQGRGRIVGCLVAGNTANGRGGGIYNTFEIANCTVVGNTAGRAGGGASGFYVASGVAPQRIVNSVFHGNDAPAFPDAEVLMAAFLGSSNAFNCIAETAGFPATAGNFAADPLFADGSFRFSSASPCIDAGAVEDWMTAAVDLDGRPRIVGDGVDIGAYEYTPDAPVGDRPDFQILCLAVHPPAPRPGAPLAIKIVVRNGGAAAGDAGVLKIWTDRADVATAGDAADAERAVGLLAAGECRTLVITGLRAPAAGQRNALAFIDGDGASAESDEANNQRGAAYRVAERPPRR